MRAGPERLRLFGGDRRSPRIKPMVQRILIRAAARGASIESEPSRQNTSRPILGASIRFTAMSGSGAKTCGMTTMLTSRMTSREPGALGQPEVAMRASFAGAAGRTLRGISARPAATGSTRTTATTISGFGLPGLKSWTFSPLPLQAARVVLISRESVPPRAGRIGPTLQPRRGCHPGQAQREPGPFQTQVSVFCDPG